MDDLDSEPYDSFLGHCPNWCECMIDKNVELTVQVIVRDKAGADQIISTLVKRLGMAIQVVVPIVCMAQ